MPDATVNGATIHYEIAGSGVPLILLHGIGSNSRSWRRQLEAFSRKFKVVAWDAPGYGQSSDPPPEIEPSMLYYAGRLRDLLELLGMFGPQGIILLGHSTGGAIAQEFYRTYPNSLRALILSDTRYMGSTAALEDRLRLIRSMTPAQLAAQRAPKLLSRSASPDLIAEVAAIMSEVRRPGYEFAAKALAASDTRDVVRNLRVPTLLIWGVEDEITPVWDELPREAKVKIIPDAGHLCYIEQPERFNQAVSEFLELENQ